MEQKTLIEDYPSISVQECQDLVNYYMQREKGTEDIDLLEEKGGLNWLYTGFKTDINKGINKKTVQAREEKYGNNKKEIPDQRSWWYFAWEAMEDFLLRVLVVCGVIAIILEMSIEEDKKLAWVEGFAILLAVAIIVIVTASNNLKKDREFNNLNSEADMGKMISIIRDGILMVDVSYQEALVGDIIVLKSGIEIPADCLLIEGFSVSIDESSLTGESKPMAKVTVEESVTKKNQLLAKKPKEIKHHDLPSSIVLAGTKVLNGNGKMLVINVGKNSAIGKINELVGSGEEELTPLQLKLEKIARDIAYFGLGAAVLLFAALLIKWIVETSIYENPKTQVKGWANHPAGEHVKHFFDIFLVSVTILIVAIPEGLPLAVTLSLAFSVSKMMDENNLVRKLAACETMGGANIICSDKTGTLTKNEMYFTNFYCGTDHVVYDAVKAQEINYDQFVHQGCREFFINTIVFNSNEDPTQKRGNPTEMALLKYIMMTKVDVLAKRDEATKVFQATFSSDRKRMSTIVTLPNGKTYAFIKGASEFILAISDFFHDLEKNTVTPMNAQLKKDFENAIEGMARKALRTIGLAYKEINPKQINLETTDERGIYEYEKNGFNIIGVCGIKDVIRPEVPESIRKCHKAGIDVKMVTGDNKITAFAIAKEVGIITDENEKTAIVMEGPEFLKEIGGVVCDNCRDKPLCDCVKNDREAEKEENKGRKVRKDAIKNKEAFDRIWPNLCVLARSRPEDKYALVTGLKDKDNVVAVTGDGTNDAPALSKASVGFAMNIAGTEVAKNAADILLMDDNFASIVVAVKWGRHIYASIQKFLVLQLTVNFVAVIITFISSLALKDPIFSTVQMLWVNLIMDTLAALALATEPPSEELLNRKPISKNEYIITLTMIKHILGQAILQIVVLCVFIFIGDQFLFDHTSRVIQHQRDILGTELFNPPLIRNGFSVYGYDEKNDGFSIHAAYNFNVFIMMTIFNFFNCRILDDRINIFEGLHKSHWFILIMVIIFVLQIIFLTFTGPAIRIAMWGLHPSGWGLCIGFGILTWIWGLLLKLIPTNKSELGLGDKELPKDQLNARNSLSIKKSHNENFFKKQESIIRRNSVHNSVKRLPSAKRQPSIKDNWGVDKNKAN